MSFTDGEDDLSEKIELENIMNQDDCARKRRRSPTAAEEAPDSHMNMPPLIIKDLSLSPSARARRPQTVGQTTEDQLTNDFDRDEDFEVCWF